MKLYDYACATAFDGPIILMDWNRIRVIDQYVTYHGHTTMETVAAMFVDYDLDIVKARIVPGTPSYETTMILNIRGDRHWADAVEILVSKGDRP